MRVLHSKDYNSKEIEELARISFLKVLRQKNREQFELLIRQTHIVELSPGDILVEQGTEVAEFYAVISGRLDVLDGGQAIGHISAGQLTGLFSLINGTSRNATLSVSGLNGARIVAINYRHFGDLEDFTFFHLESKLTLYREVEKFARWKLDAHVALTSDPIMKILLDGLQLFEGERNSLAELQYFSDQIKHLSVLFEKMNQTAKK